jgi:hypothetical protein
MVLIFIAFSHQNLAGGDCLIELSIINRLMMDTRTIQSDTFSSCTAAYIIIFIDGAVEKSLFDAT